ncbi:hypothetical protein D3C85_681350 [compost metagenome]
MAASSALRVRPFSRASLPQSDLSSVMASKTISLETNWSPAFCDSLSARFSKATNSRLTCTSPPVPDTFGKRSMDAPRALDRPPTLTPARCNSERAPPSS